MKIIYFEIFSSIFIYLKFFYLSIKQNLWISIIKLLKIIEFKVQKPASSRLACYLNFHKIVHDWVAFEWSEEKCIQSINIAQAFHQIHVIDKIFQSLAYWNCALRCNFSGTFVKIFEDPWKFIWEESLKWVKWIQIIFIKIAQFTFRGCDF